MLDTAVDIARHPGIGHVDVLQDKTTGQFGSLMVTMACRECRVIDCVVKQNDPVDALDVSGMVSLRSALADKLAPSARNTVFAMNEAIRHPVLDANLLFDGSDCVGARRSFFWVGHWVCNGEFSDGSSAQRV